MRASRRGVTLLEVLIVVALSVPLTIAGLGTFSSTRKAWQHGVERSGAAVDTRGAVDRVVGVLRSAQPLNACADPGREPPTAVDVDDCATIVRRAAPVRAGTVDLSPTSIALAEATRICVWTTTPVTVGDVTVRAPLTCAAFSPADQALMLERIDTGPLPLAPTPGALGTGVRTKLFPNYSDATAARAGLDFDRSRFRYFGWNGEEVTAEDQVALVEVSLALVGGPVTSVTLQVGSSGYGALS